ncbi:MAG: hypothetical protein HOW73_00895 [Polyangiaceae bacterium]|nr:hypothetical protein [Polyangiaceae bacterium]
MTSPKYLRPDATTELADGAEPTATPEADSNSSQKSQQTAKSKQPNQVGRGGRPGSRQHRSAIGPTAVPRKTMIGWRGSGR